jgi:CBS-domain-containing membrane protein
VLLGRVRRSALDAAGDATAEAVMEAGPSTVRADAAPPALRERVERSGLRTVVITDPDGRLLGVVRRDELPEG